MESYYIQKCKNIKKNSYGVNSLKNLRKTWKKKINKINKEISDMIIDSSDEDNGNPMPRYNSLYNDNFLDDINMILED